VRSTETGRPDGLNGGKAYEKVTALLKRYRALKS
jgi:hypothetical protein